MIYGLSSRGALVRLNVAHGHMSCSPWGPGYVLFKLSQKQSDMRSGGCCGAYGKSSFHSVKRQLHVFPCVFPCVLPFGAAVLVIVCLFHSSFLAEEMLWLPWAHSLWPVLLSPSRKNSSDVMARRNYMLPFSHQPCVFGRNTYSTRRWSAGKWRCFKHQSCTSQSCCSVFMGHPISTEVETLILTCLLLHFPFSSGAPIKDVNRQLSGQTRPCLTFLWFVWSCSSSIGSFLL